MSILSHRGYSIPLKNTDEAVIAHHKANLTIVPYVEKEEYASFVQPIKIYQQTAKRLYMPRHYGMANLGEPDKDKLTTKDYPKIDNLKITKPPRPHQIPVIQKCLKDINRIGGGVISLACGMGKTYLALYFCCQFKVKTLVVCHTTSLMLQWKDRIMEFVPRAKIGIVQQSKCEVEDSDIIIASLKTVALKDYPPKTFESVGLVVWDEIHLMVTNLFSKAFPKLSTKYAIGLSATPNRKDRCETIFQYYIGPILYVLKRKQNNKIIARCVTLLMDRDQLPLKYNRFGKVMYTSTLVRIVKDECRIARIVDMIIDFASDGRKVLVLSEYVDHLRKIKALLKKKIATLKDNCKSKLKKLYLDFSYDLYIGEMNSSQRQATEQKDVILGTYKLASVGMDIPTLNTLILASPRKEIEQSVGRILRKESDSKHKPLIVDIIDNHGIFIAQARVRKKFYRKYGYTLEHIQMLPDGHVKSKRVVSTKLKDDDKSTSIVKSFAQKRSLPETVDSQSSSEEDSREIKGLQIESDSE